MQGYRLDHGCSATSVLCACELTGAGEAGQAFRLAGVRHRKKPAAAITARAITMQVHSTLSRLLLDYLSGRERVDKNFTWPVQRFKRHSLIHVTSYELRVTNYELRVTSELRVHELYGLPLTRYRSTDVHPYL